MGSNYWVINFMRRGSLSPPFPLRLRKNTSIFRASWAYAIQASVSTSSEDGPNPKSYSTPAAKRHLECQAEANSPGTIKQHCCCLYPSLLCPRRGRAWKGECEHQPWISGTRWHHPRSVYLHPKPPGTSAPAHRCSPNTTSCYTSLGLSLHNTHILSFQYPGLLVPRTTLLLQLLSSTHLR